MIHTTYAFGKPLEIHFCQVTVRYTTTVLAEYTVHAADWYAARHHAVWLFEAEHTERSKQHDWFVDSCLVD